MTITASRLLTGGTHAEAVAELHLAIALLDEDRHTRAMAQAEAAGITGIRDALTANA